MMIPFLRPLPRSCRSRPGAAAPLLVALLVLGGCASSGVSSSASSGSRDEITREQLLEMPEATAFDVVRRLRGRWLRPRGAGTSIRLAATDVIVYINNQREPGGVDALRSFRAGGLQSIEFFDASQATIRWGTGHPAGAIVVSIL